MSKIITVRRLFSFNYEVINKLSKNISLRLDDGYIIENVSYKKIIIYRYLLNFIGKYDLQIDRDLWIDNFLVNGYFSNKTYLNLYSVVLEKVVKPHLQKYGNNDIMATLFEDMYLTIDLINNKLNAFISPYVATLDIFTLLKVQFNKKLIDTMAEVSKNPSPEGVLKSYDVFDEIIREPRYRSFSITLLYLSKTASEGQVKQMFGCRGYITELNNKIFKIPMTNSFLLGFKNPYESTIESRAGTKALSLSGKAIEDTEYASREISLATMTVEGIYHGDCGKPVYVDFYVKGDIFDDDDNMISKSDIPNLVGKRYLDIKDNVEKIITKKDTHLENGYIRLRSAVYCGLSDKKKICSACIGAIGDTILPTDNLGNLAGNETARASSQGLLSAKHLLMTAVMARIRLVTLAKKYFLVRSDEFLLFKANILNKKIKEVYLKVKQSEAWGLDTLSRVSDIFSININKVSRISTITLVFQGANSIEEVELDIKSGSSYTHFTLEALNHIREVGYKSPDEDHFLINVNKFDNKKPMFKYDKIEFNLALLNRDFKSMLKTRKYIYVDGVMRSEFTPDVLVQNLFDLLNSKLNINIALIEIIVYAFTVKDLNSNNYDLGRGAVSRDVVGFKGAIDNRSIGSSYGWDDLQGKVLNPILYDTRNKPSTPLDVLLKPYEVIKYGE